MLAGFAAYHALWHGGPGRRDIDTSVFIVYPGATLVKDSFQRSESGRYIDTGSFSNPTRLVRQYRLAASVPREEFERWRQATYPPPGWELKSRVDANEMIYTRTVGRRHHFLDVRIVAGGPQDPLVTEYGITYSVT